MSLELLESQPELACVHQPFQILLPDGLSVSLDDVGKCRDGDKMPLTNPDQGVLHRVAIQALLLAWLSSVPIALILAGHRLMGEALKIIDFLTWNFRLWV
jgi:hypothetical protein